MGVVRGGGKAGDSPSVTSRLLTREGDTVDGGANGGDEGGNEGGGEGADEKGCE
eukprot:CAMPEP_0181168128 /NCGR_PEP_ID=MMETSP1096-20121128/96_1 /TAXON_ID=156174 ORGANISM="Chrysochromulina ericina, Strain CCMP281" /NCGR_SAMPLE_ID=MMETSP1096 /ASSEMBLY_ACC=CAM_ASM_000453 /LENGTH=53 /DNA_ID=CAMNT_0023255459 /DNA_START=507 /DNA_END=666 /DNA_ORIENTATION=+